MSAIFSRCQCAVNKQTGQTWAFPNQWQGTCQHLEDAIYSLYSHKENLKGHIWKMLFMASAAIRKTFKGGFINGLWAHNWENSFCSNIHSNYSIRPQVCTCHNSWAVVTCAKLWSDWINISLCKSFTNFLPDSDFEHINPLWNGSQVFGQYQ